MSDDIVEVSARQWQAALPAPVAAHAVGREALGHAEFVARLPFAPADGVGPEQPGPPTGLDVRRHWLVILQDGQPPVLCGFGTPEALLVRLAALKGDVYAIPFDGVVLEYTQEPRHLYLADGETAVRLDIRGRPVRVLAAAEELPPLVEDYFAGEEVFLTPFSYRNPDNFSSAETQPPAKPKPKPKRKRKKKDDGDDVDVDV